MSRAPSGKVLKVVVHQKQKNGDIYVVERDTRYDPAKKYNVILKTRLLYKIPKGASDPVPTRPRKKPASCRSAEEAEACTDACTGIEASCMRTGLEAILSHAGKASGVDQAVRRAMDPGDALKAVSIARYIVATDGGSLPERLCPETWGTGSPGAKPKILKSMPRLHSLSDCEAPSAGAPFRGGADCMKEKAVRGEGSASLASRSECAVELQEPAVTPVPCFDGCK